VAMEIQTAEQIEEESIGGDSEVEVLEPLEGHTITLPSVLYCDNFFCRAMHFSATAKRGIVIACRPSVRL